MITRVHPQAHLLERAIHADLELRGQKIADAPGNEWFDTNPAEITGIIRFLVGASDLRGTIVRL